MKANIKNHIGADTFIHVNLFPCVVTLPPVHIRISLTVNMLCCLPCSLYRLLNDDALSVRTFPDVKRELP